MTRVERDETSRYLAGATGVADANTTPLRTPGRFTAPLDTSREIIASTCGSAFSQARRTDVRQHARCLR